MYTTQHNRALKGNHKSTFENTFGVFKYSKPVKYRLKSVQRLATWRSFSSLK